MLISCGRQYLMSVKNTMATSSYQPVCKRQRTQGACHCDVINMSRHIQAEDLNCCYGILYKKSEADRLLSMCEANIEYCTGALSKVHVFGKWCDIHRKQAAYGDNGLTYTFSGITIPAKPWPPFLDEIRLTISKIVGLKFNFVLVNRYASGTDFIGEHRDDERDMDCFAPIASLSLGKSREFLFRHESVKLKKAEKPDPCSMKVELQNGSLLLMNYPTNQHWYHSLPVRKKEVGVRINMTFRKLIPAKCRPLTKGNSSSN